MREFGPIKFILGTTPEEVAAAKPYLGIGRVQLGITKNLMQLGGLQQASRSVTLPDGTLIHSQSVLGQDIVKIEPAISAAAQQARSVAQQAPPAVRRRKKLVKTRIFDLETQPVAVVVRVDGQAFFVGAWEDGRDSVIGGGSSQGLADDMFPGDTGGGAFTIGRVEAGATSASTAVLIAGDTVSTGVIEAGTGQLLLFNSLNGYTDVSASFPSGGGHPDAIIVSNGYATLVLGGDNLSNIVYCMMHNPSPIHTFRSTVFFTEHVREEDDV